MFALALAIFLAVMGDTTSAQPVPDSSAITETVSFTFLSPSLGWRLAVRWNANAGSEGPAWIERTTNGGLHWRRIARVSGAGHGSGTSFDLSVSTIVFADRRDGWLYGRRLFATHDGGVTWRRLPIRGSETALTVSGATVWRLDASCPSGARPCRFRLLTSQAISDGWTLMPWRPPNVDRLGGSALARFGQRDAWLISGPSMVGSHLALRLFGTRDRGRSWHPLPMPCSEHDAGSLYAQLVPYTGVDLWLVCASQPSAGAQPKSVFRSSDGGRTWRMVADSGGFGMERTGLHNLTFMGYMGNVAVTGSSDAWVALGRGTLMHTADGGKTWGAAIPYGIANPGGGGVGPVQFVDARDGWLLSFPNVLFRTRDGGKHWRPIGLS